MKKFTTLMLSFLCIAALLTGCVESDIGVKLNADETGTISATIGIEEDFYDQLVDMGATVFEDKETTTYEHDGKTYEVPTGEMLADAILKAIYHPNVCTCGEYQLPENLKRFFAGKEKKAASSCCCGTSNCC